MTPMQRMIKARANLVMSEPFFGTLALRLKMVEDPKCSTAWTNGITIGFNPKFIADLPLSKLTGLLAHEVMHNASLHHIRRGARDPGKWNMACDFVINAILQKAGVDLPDGGLIDPKYESWTADAVYNHLPDPPGGMGAGGDPGGCGEVRDSPGAARKDQTATKEEEADWKQALAQAAHVAKQAGKLPAGIQELVEELLEPILPWKNILRRFLTEKRVDDYSWNKPDRRFITQGIFLPSRVTDDGGGTIVIAVDTSGSISSEQLQQFGGEIKSVLADARPTKLYVIYCDAAVEKVEEYTGDGFVEFTAVDAVGRGGTSFIPPFEYVNEHQLEPRAIVYLTDGYGPFPTDSDFPTLWAINNDQVIPPFGEHLVLTL